MPSRSSSAAPRGRVSTGPGADGAGRSRMAEDTRVAAADPSIVAYPAGGTRLESTAAHECRRAYTRCRPVRASAREAGLVLCVRRRSRHRPGQGRPRLRLPRHRRPRRPRPGHARADPVAGDPAGVDQGVDRAQGQRAPAGDRPRRARPQAVSLSPALDRGARRDQVHAHAGVRAGAAGHPPPRRRRPAPPAAVARARARHRRRAARADADPRRQRRVRPHQRIVRPDHAARSPRRRPRPPRPLPLPRQERRDAADRPATTRCWRAASSAARICPARRCSSTSTRPARAGRSRRPTSTTTCATWPGRSSPPRTSAPGRARCWRRARSAPTSSWRRPTARKRFVSEAVGQVAERLGNTKAVCRKCYIHPAVIDAFLDGETIAPFVRTTGAARGGRHQLSRQKRRRS